MRNAPNIIAIGDLVREITERGRKVPLGMMWVPKRRQGPGGLRRRMRAAWLVLSGRADALEWG